MSEIGHLSQDERSFLEPYLPRHAGDSTEHETRMPNTQASKRSPISTAAPADLPFVTLTYASSLDSMIALAPGARTTLSGPETKSMTHYLRLHHDAILIGAGTAAVDDPGLNCRYPEASLADQPQPVILDPNGRWNPCDKKACHLAAEGLGKAPWIIARDTAPNTAEALHQIGGDCLLIPSDLEGRSGPSASYISWRAILKTLKSRGINSVMIEGGATVINTLLATPGLVNAVIITIAPTFLGAGGVAVSPAPKFQGDDRVNAAWLDATSWRQFGADVVLCSRLRAE